MNLKNEYSAANLDKIPEIISQSRKNVNKLPRKVRNQGSNQGSHTLFSYLLRALSHNCRKYKCRYFRKDVVFEGMELRLFFVQYGKSRTWNILLTTDKSLSFIKVFEYYQIRWNQEVMYREGKQYLGLGKCQSTDQIPSENWGGKL